MKPNIHISSIKNSFPRSFGILTDIYLVLTAIAHDKTFGIEDAELEGYIDRLCLDKGLSKISFSTEPVMVSFRQSYQDDPEQRIYQVRLKKLRSRNQYDLHLTIFSLKMELHYDPNEAKNIF